MNKAKTKRLIGSSKGGKKMNYYCPTCGEMITDLFFSTLGHTICFYCNSLINLTNAIKDIDEALNIKKEFEEKELHYK